MGHDVVEHRSEDRIVGQQVLARLRLDLHSDRLVELHRDRALLEVRVQPGVHARREAGVFEVIRVDGRADGGPACGRAVDRQRVAPLRFHALGEGVAIVDKEDVQDAQVQARQEIGECGVGLERVDVRVDRLDGGDAGAARHAVSAAWRIEGHCPRHPRRCRRPGERRQPRNEGVGEACPAVYQSAVCVNMTAGLSSDRTRRISAGRPMGPLDESLVAFKERMAGQRGTVGLLAALQRAQECRVANRRILRNGTIAHARGAVRDHPDPCAVPKEAVEHDARVSGGHSWPCKHDGTTEVLR